MSLLNIAGSFVFALNIDSLKTGLKNSSNDTLRVLILNQIAWELKFSDPDSAREYINESQLLSNTLSYEKGKGDGFNILGVVEYLQGNFSVAQKHFESSLTIRIKLGDVEGQSGIYNNLGLINSELGNYPESIKFYRQSLNISEALQNKTRIASSLNNIGNVYRRQGNPERALEYFDKALKINVELNNLLEQSNNLNNIGSVYFEKEKYNKALEYFRTALDLKRKLKNREGELNCMQNIGNIWMNLNNFDSAGYYLNESLAGKNELGDQQGVPGILLNLGFVNQKKRLFKLALGYMKNSLEVAEEIESIDDQKAAHLGLAETYDSLGKTSDAFLHYKLYAALKDSLQGAISMDKISEIQTLFETEKRDKEIQILNKDKEIQTAEIQKQKVVRNSFIFGFTVFVIFSGIVFMQKNKIKHEKLKSENLLLNILPRETAQELIDNGKASPKYYENVSVLFTDFKNFTLVSELLSHEELVNEINFCYSRFDRIMDEHGIEKIKTIGDSYMCAAGLPVFKDDHAVSAVRAGLEIRDFITGHIENRKLSGLPFFEIRIGIHSGPVIAGVVGIKKFAYDIWGDTVNIASRMESSAETGKVNISESTYLLVKDNFNCTYRGRVEAKNKGLVNMYFAEEIAILLPRA